MKNFTPEEAKVIAHAAQGVWQEIGCDCLQALADEGAGESATMSRSHVIEVVLDASRLEQRLKRTKGVDPALIKRVADDIYSGKSEVEQYLRKEVFKYSRYGF